MSDITLPDVLAFNDQLATLAEIRIPSNFNAGISPDAFQGELENINRSLSLRVELGQSLLTAVAENQEVPPLYRSALLAGLRSNRLSVTLEGGSRQAAAQNELRSILGRSLIPPLIVSSLAFFGFILLCLYYSPTVESMYQQLGRAPGRWTQFLILLREWLPIWATLIPILFLGMILLWQRGWGGWQFWLPGARPYLTAIRNANFASQLIFLIENGVSLSESLPLAAAVTGDQGIIAASQLLSTAAPKADYSSSADPTMAEPTTDTQSLRSLPPLLRWALAGDLGDQSLLEVLVFAEQTYLHAAQRRIATWYYFLPGIFGAVLGGLVVLAYGLSLFGPFVQLLEELAR